MSKRIRVTLHVEVADGVLPVVVGMRVLRLVRADPKPLIDRFGAVDYAVEDDDA